MVEKRAETSCPEMDCSENRLKPARKTGVHKDGLLDRTVLNLNDAFSTLQTWTSPKHNIQRDNPNWKEGDNFRSILGALAACTPGGSPLSSVKDFMDDAVDRVDKAVDKVVDSPRNRPNTETKTSSIDHQPDLNAFIDSLEDDFDEELQMHRLTSWDTNGTFGTIGTHQSMIPFPEANGTSFQNAVDDDGNPINPRILEKAIESSQKRTVKRKRLVKFAYPPVSSLRQCPRAAEEDLPSMFFSELELDQLEDDRLSTFVADDVEIVAVASSLSEVDAPGQDILDDPPREGRLGSSYVSTPRRKKTPHHTAFDESVSAPLSKPSRRPATPGPRSKREETEKVDHSKDKRLIKSVQIYLRERSTANSSRR